MPRVKKSTKEDSNFLSIQDPCERFFVQSGAEIGAKFGQEIVSSADQEDKNLKLLYVPDLMHQWNLGRKGYALGRILYIMGFEGSGKTSRALWVANLAYRSGGFAAMVETEQASSSEHMRHYLDFPEKMRVYHPETIEDAMQISIDILKSFKEIDPKGLVPKVLILDSIAGSSDERTEEDGNIVAPKVGGFAKLIKDATNVIKNQLKETNTLWVVLNQARDRIETSFSGMVPEMDKIVSTGGRAIPFAATYWEILKKQGSIKEAGEKCGFKVKLSMKKNKLREPEGVSYYNVKYGYGFDFVPETMEMLVTTKICGMSKNKQGFFCPQVGIEETNPISAAEMYQLVHSEEHIKAFQEELDIITTDEVLQFKPPSKIQAKGETESESI